MKRDMLTQKGRDREDVPTTREDESSRNVTLEGMLEVMGMPRDTAKTRHPG